MRGVILNTLIISILFVFFSCNLKKKDPSNKPKSEVSNEVEKKNIREEVVFEVFFKMEKNDQVQLYFEEDIFANFSEKKTFYTSTKGDDKIQNIVYRFPKDVYPVKLRLDVSSFEGQTAIEIEKIVISRAKYEIVIEGKNIIKYFTPNKYIQNIEGTGEFLLSVQNNIYDPYLTSNEKLNYELDIL